MLCIVKSIKDINEIDFNSLKPAWIVYDAGFKIVEQLGKFAYGLPTYIINARASESGEFEKVIIVENSIGEEKERLEYFVGQSSVEHFQVITEDCQDYYKRNGIGDSASIYCNGQVYHGTNYEDILNVLSIMHKQIDLDEVIKYRQFSKGTWYIENSTLYTPSQNDFVIIDTQQAGKQVEILNKLYPESKIILSK